MSKSQQYIFVKKKMQRYGSLEIEPCFDPALGIVEIK